MTMQLAAHFVFVAITPAPTLTLPRTTFAAARILISFKGCAAATRRNTSEEELARLYHIPIPKQTDPPTCYSIAPFARLWENWKDPESGEWPSTCTIITGEPNELVAQIHPVCR